MHWELEGSGSLAAGVSPSRDPCHRGGSLRAGGVGISSQVDLQLLKLGVACSTVYKGAVPPPECSVF